MHTGAYEYFAVRMCYFDFTWLANVLWKAQSRIQYHWECVSFTILSNSLLFCLAVRFSLKWRDDKHELHILYFWLCIMHDPQSLVRVGFLQRIWTISHQTTGEQEEGQRESQQNPPVTVSFSQKKPLSVLSLANESLWLYQWEPYREISSAEIIKSQSIKITTPQRGEHVKSNHQSLDSDSEPKYYQLYNWKQLKHL